MGIEATRDSNGGDEGADGGGGGIGGTGKQWDLEAGKVPSRRSSRAVKRDPFFFFLNSSSGDGRELVLQNQTFWFY